MRRYAKKYAIQNVQKSIYFLIGLEVGLENMPMQCVSVCFKNAMKNKGATMVSFGGDVKKHATRKVSITNGITPRLETHKYT